MNSLVFSSNVLLCSLCSMKWGRTMTTAPPSTSPGPTVWPMSWTSWARTSPCPWWPTKLSRFSTTSHFCCVRSSSPVWLWSPGGLQSGSLQGSTDCQAHGHIRYQGIIKGDYPISLQGNIIEIPLSGFAGQVEVLACHDMLGCCCWGTLRPVLQLDLIQAEVGVGQSTTLIDATGHSCWFFLLKCFRMWVHKSDSPADVNSVFSSTLLCCNCPSGSFLQVALRTQDVF